MKRLAQCEKECADRRLKSVTQARLSLPSFCNAVNKQIPYNDGTEPGNNLTDTGLSET